MAPKQKTRGLGPMVLLWKGRLRAGKGRKFGPYPKRCRARARKKERGRGVSGALLSFPHYTHATLGRREKSEGEALLRFGTLCVYEVGRVSEE